jgi:cell division septation protein DedD
MMAATIMAAAAIGHPTVAFVTATASTTVRSGIEAWQVGDYGRAVGIWRALADKGDNDAAFNLGQAYRLGRGLPADSGQAKKYYEKAARAGHLDAQVSLGLLLFDNGNRAAALTWLKRAADRGEARAMLITGTAFFNGDGMERDQVRGYAYVSRSAAQGLAAAKATLGDMDKVMSLSDRRKGVALALDAAIARPARPKSPNVLTSPAKPPLIKQAAAKPQPTVNPQLTINPQPSVRPQPVAKPHVTPKPEVVIKPQAANGGWRIQLGAFGTRSPAQALFAKLGPSLPGVGAYYIPAGAVIRLQAGPYASRAAASKACARLAPRPCFAVAAR